MADSPRFLGREWFHADETVAYSVMGIVTAILAAGLIWLGSRDRQYAQIASAALGLLISIPSAYSAYAVFLW